MAVFLQEVMLHRPRVVDAQPVGQFHLLQGVLEQPVLVPLIPGFRKLQFIEDAELHDSLSPVLKFYPRVADRTHGS